MHLCASVSLPLKRNFSRLSEVDNRTLDNVLGFSFFFVTQPYTPSALFHHHPSLLKTSVCSFRAVFADGRQKKKTRAKRQQLRAPSLKNLAQMEERVAATAATDVNADKGWMNARLQRKRGE